MNTQAKDNKHTGLVLGIGLLLAAAYLLVCRSPADCDLTPAAPAGEQKEEFNNRADIEHLMSERIDEWLEAIRWAESRDKPEESLAYYQEVFDNAQGEIYGPLGGGGHTYTDARRYCLSRLNAQGEKQKARYRAMYDADAQNLLDRATGGDEGELLREVVRRYLLMTSGAVALRRLAWQAFERQQYNEATALWYEMLKYHPSKVDAAIIAGQAAACAEMNSRDGLRKAAQIAGARFPEAAVLVRGKETSLAQFIRGKMASLDPEDVVEGEWRMPGKDPAHRRVVKSAPDLREKVWSCDFPTSIAGVQRYTAVRDDTVYVNTGEEVIALSLWDGTPMWRYKARKTPLGTTRSASDGRRVIVLRGPAGTKTVFMPPNPLARPSGVTVGKNTVYAVNYGGLAAIRRDTGRLLWLAEVGDDDIPLSLAPGTFLFAVSALKADNSIYSIGVRRSDGSQVFVVYCHDTDNGKIRWRRELNSENIQMSPTGGMFALGRDDLDFHTTPAFLCESGGVLYVSTRGGSVAAIDRHNGELIWLTLYDRGKGGKTAPLMGDGGWDYCLPVVAGGRLVVAPTDSEYLHVFDTRTGRPLWYKPRMSKQGDLRHIVAVDAQRKLIFAAGDAIVAYDLEKGTIRAESSPPHGQSIGPGLIHENRLYLPTSGGISAADIDASLQKGVMVVNQVIAWRDILTEDELKDKHAVAKAAGNIVACEGALVVTSGSRVTMLYNPRGGIAQLNEEMEKGDDDGRLTLKRGLLYASEALGEKEKALKDFSTALKKLRRRAKSLEGFDEENYVRYHGSAPTTAGRYGRLVIQARKSTVTVAFKEAARLLGQDPAQINYRELYKEAVEPEVDDKVVKHLETVKNHAVDAGPYVDSQLILLERAGKLGDRRGRVDLLVEMSHKWGESGYDFSRYRPGVIIREVGLFCSEAIADVIRDHGAALYAKHDRKAAMLFQRTRRRRDIDALLEVVERYPNSVSAEKALLTAMDLAGKLGNHKLRGYLAQEYLSRFRDGKNRLAAMAAYAESLERLGDVSGARRVLHEMRSLAGVAGAEVFALRGRKQRVASYVERKLASLKKKDRDYSIDLPFENARLRQAAQRESADYAEALTLEPTGLAPPGTEGRIFLLLVPTGSECAVLRCLDLNTLDETWSTELPAVAVQGRIFVTGGGFAMPVQHRRRRHGLGYSGNSLLLHYGPHLISFNPHNGGVRWSMGKESRNQSDDIITACITDNTIYFARGGKNGAVHAVDGRSGRIVWEQKLSGPICGDITATPDRLLVITARADNKARGDLVLLERRTGRVKGVVENLCPPSQAVFQTPFSAASCSGLPVKPLAAERVLVLSGDRLGLYGLEKGDTIWENRNVAPPGRRQLPKPTRHAPSVRLPSSVRVLALGDGVCATSAGSHAAVRTFDLKNGKLLREILPPDGWLMVEWFLDGGRLETFSVRRCENADYGFNFMQSAYDAASGELLYSNIFPTGTFLYRPLPTGNHVIAVKENLIERQARQIEVIIYSNKTGKIIAPPLQLEGVGFVPGAGLTGEGQRLVIKGEWKIVVLRIEDDEREED